jgi:hypothetical protein
VLVCAVAPAAAIEPQAAADALAKAIAGGTDSTVTFDAARDDGGDVVIEGLAINRNGNPEEGQIKFAETIIAAPVEGGDGIFSTDSIEFSGGTITGEASGTIGSATLSEVTIVDPATVAEDRPAKGVVFGSVELLELVAEQADQPGEVSIDRIYVEVGEYDNGVPLSSSGEIEGFTLPPEAFAEAEVGPQAIGYEELVIGVTWDGSRDPAAKTLTIDDFTVSVADAGDLSFTAELGNVPEPAALRSAEGSDQAAEIVVDAVTIRYEDNSLTGRILDMMAQQQGITREEYAAQVAGALPFLLAALNNPAFQEQVSTAVGAFLQDPQSISASIAPEPPISAGEIMSIGMTSPQTLPERLKATVSANNE